MIADAPVCFGTSVRIVVLKVAGRKPVLKKLRIEFVTSSPTIYHAALKKPEERPSGPGDLFGLSLRTVEATSSASGLVERICF